MRSFKQIEADYQFTPIRANVGSLAGYLHLGGPETKVVLNSTDFHHFDDDENGWFDLELRDHRGFQILLHNALSQSQSMPGSVGGKSAGSYTSSIFPNTVIFGTENLRNDKSLHHMSFELEAAENFFVYDTIEWRSMHGQKDKQTVLDAIRSGAWKPPRGLKSREHASDPADIYIVHKPKTYLNITLEDMKIKVWHSRSRRGLGWTSHEIKITPMIGVTFSTPVSIDQAIDRLWRIKGFFDQLALCDLSIKRVSFSKFKKGWPSADVYLSNEIEDGKKRRREVHPTNVPYSRWRERNQFSKIMESWLAVSDQRHFFRAAIRLSLLRLEKEIDASLITLLMAGIESLPELGGKSGVSSTTISKMADAAHAVDASIDLDAIRGLLGAFQRTSPRQRLTNLANGLFPKSEDISTFVSIALQLRNKFAHGTKLTDGEQSIAGDVARTLVYLCVTYDLHTTGFPIDRKASDERNLLALTSMNWAWQGYKTRNIRG
ncbi:hypothetical protein GCM10023115_09800 [Pontixanthobacter gangjinensis]|uniref:ApeA N-terminal domain-containing protein n=1 Tax=Pontixanthobacter gangjinensis TaxID=1028742 RepID=A0A6I4SM46_9SPHN|nr:hypothetical protein [Pontixanthobacter gangjinensis]MXO56226.1 hypothetical protein [Pontixanthobacter gangjinensis]